MIQIMSITPMLILIFLLTFPFANAKESESKLTNYIIHVERPAILTQYDDLKRYHKSFLHTQSDIEDRIIYSYQHAISGFAARLTKEELEAISAKDGFIAAHAEKMYRKLTTHTPAFLNLQRNLGFWKESNFGKGVIIGVLDDGILPTHPSFNDQGMPPPPAKWKGKCEFNQSICNNKLIGARSLNLAAKGNETTLVEEPFDDDGHGTHTASTAAGTFVKNGNVLGQANGTVVGMAPKAHLAIYKVCFGEDCPEADIIAGIDAAVADGVDIISISLGRAKSLPFFEDGISIASFGAIQKGIFVSCAGGNSGPFESTIVNDAPWILTVGASTIDRSIRSTAKLGNGDEFNGESLFQPNISSNLLPLVYAGSNGESNSSLCIEGSLNATQVRGKVVLCERGMIDRIEKGEAVKKAGGIAMIIMNREIYGFSTSADAHVLPATHVSFSDGERIKSYINSTTTPKAKILFEGTIIGDKSAPIVASFSSRGPSNASPGILKPDIIGPGVNILAAGQFPLDDKSDTKSSFSIESGTSMACPHLSGIAALLKSSHPNWSPAAIKSSIMTSSDILNLEGKPILDQIRNDVADIFATGAGHVNPSKANDPGLVYDIQPDDYIPYLCGLNYTDEQVSTIARRKLNCSKMNSIRESDLNYPSFSIIRGPLQTFARTVTNVGEGNSTYRANIVAPRGVDVVVKPTELYFSEVNEKKTYSVTFSIKSEEVGKLSQGYLEWVSDKHLVRSVIAVKFK